MHAKLKVFVALVLSACLSVVCYGDEDIDIKNRGDYANGNTISVYRATESLVVLHYHVYSSLPFAVRLPSSYPDNLSDSGSGSKDYLATNSRIITVSEMLLLLEVATDTDSVKFADFRGQVWAGQHVRQSFHSDLSGTVKSDGTPANPPPGVAETASALGAKGKVFSVVEWDDSVYVLHESAEANLLLHSISLHRPLSQNANPARSEFGSILVSGSAGHESIKSVSLEVDGDGVFVRVVRNAKEKENPLLGEEIWQVLSDGSVVRRDQDEDHE